MNSARLYVFAPLADTPVLAGRIDWLAGIGTFRYAPGWLQAKAAYALDPRNLPLRDGPFDTRLNQGVHGVLSDAGPDAWGRRLLELQRGRIPDTPLELLRVANGSGTGALLFSRHREHPDPPRPLASLHSLPELEQAARRIAAGMPVSDEMFELVFASGSPLGGARPKVNIALEDSPWIAKLGRADDLVDVPRMEWACLALARASGLDVPEHRLIEANGRAVLLVKRFDRTPTGALHYLSFHSLLSHPKINPADVIAPEGLCTYGALAAVCRQIGVADAGRQLFHRLALNLAIGNTDDHLRNHGLLHGPDGWRLAPAFDLTALGGSHQAIGVGTQGRQASRENALSDLPRFGLRQEQAEAILRQVDAALQQAPALLAEAGLSQADSATVLQRMRRQGAST